MIRTESKDILYDAIDDAIADIESLKEDLAERLSFTGAALFLEELVRKLTNKRNEALAIDQAAESEALEPYEKSDDK